MNFLTLVDTRPKLLVVILITAAIAVMISALIKGIALSIIVALSIFTILLISKPLWLSENHGKTKVRVLSLGIVTLVVTSPFFMTTLVQTIIQKLASSLGDTIPLLANITFPNNNSITIYTYLFVTICLFIVNYFNRDTTAMGVHHTPIDKEFPEKGYKQRLMAFCNVLRKDIDAINIESNWSDEYFEPLDAEVEIKTGNRKKKKVTDLLTAIKKDKKSKVFLVLGDPGSGKSVALRKLYSELLEEVRLTWKIPIYVNLREWETKEKWTAASPPSVIDLLTFIKKSLKEKGDPYANDFIDTYFDKMWHYGRLFFLIDSFDEIPSVLDEDESSPLIESLSSTLFTFLSGAPDSRGILASRIYRRPTRIFNAKTILEIRPFSEKKILERFMKMLDYSPTLERLIFSERQEFISLARNPFTASLIINYAKKNDYTLPRNQIGLYDHYILERLEFARPRTTQNVENLSNETIIDTAIEIAYFMFASQDYGLEAPKSILINALPSLPVDRVIDFICFSKIGRLGSGSEKLFSFVHRRFNEFFVAKKLIKSKNLVPRDSIPTDSRWRDSLVLYCEIASDVESKNIARFCWDTIAEVKDKILSISNPRYLASIHCLRFLNDAFRSRLDLIKEFHTELSDFVLSQVDADNILETKLAIEAAGLVEPNEADKLIQEALDLKNPWISETALRSCRNLAKISIDLENKVIDQIRSYDPWEIFKRKNELLFSFKLSDAFKNVRNFLNATIIDYCTALFGILLLIIASPTANILIGITIIIAYTIVRWITDFFLSFINEKRTSHQTLLSKELNAGIVSSIIMGLPFTHIPSIRLFLSFLVFLHPLISELEYAQFSTYLHTIGGVLIFPWFAILYSLKKMNISLWIPRAKMIAIGSPFFGIAYVLINYLQEVFDFLEQYMPYILAMAAIFMIIPIIQEFIARIKDIKLNNKIPIDENLSRNLIERDLGRFKTPYGRRLYIKKIEHLNLKKIKGDWANSKMPAYRDDASTMLAKLEEGWRGFQR